jgi:LPS export ABC transporter protein LptC
MKRVLCFAALCGLAACNPSVQVQQSPSPSPSAIASPAVIPLKISGQGTAERPVRIVAQAKGNRVQYELLAASYESIGAQGNTRVNFKNPHITFYGKDGSTLIADAPQAIGDQTTNTIEMLGGVKGRKNDGTTLDCDDLKYDHVTEMIYGNGHVVITSPTGFRATGDHFQSDVSLTHTRMQ